MPRRLLVKASRRFTLVLVAVIFLLITVFVSFYWQAAKKSDQLMIEQIRGRQKVLLKSTSLAIGEFFQTRQARLTLLSRMAPIYNLEEKSGRDLFRLLVEQSRGDRAFTGIIRVDKKGEIVWVENFERDYRGEGASVADRDYFKKAVLELSQGEVFVSEPMISRAGMTKGKLVVIMGIPVFKNEDFNGLVMLSFPLRDLAEKFLSPLIEEEKTNLYLTDTKEFILASNEIEAEGKKISDFILANNSQSGALITSWVPVEVGDQKWSLWLSTPNREAISLSFPLRLGQWRQMVVLILGVTVLVLILIVIIRFAKEESFIEGFTNGFKNGFSKTKKKS